MQLSDIDLTDMDRFQAAFPHEWFTFLHNEQPVWFHPPNGTEGYERRRRERTLSRAAPRCEEGRFGVHGSANSRRGRAPAHVKIWRGNWRSFVDHAVNSCAHFRTRIGSGWWDGVPRMNGALRRRRARSRPTRTARPR